MSDGDEVMRHRGKIEEIGRVESFEEVIERSQGGFDRTAQGMEAVGTGCRGTVDCHRVDTVSKEQRFSHAILATIRTARSSG